MRKFVPALALSLGMAFAGSATAAPYVGLMFSTFKHTTEGQAELKLSGPSVRMGASISEWIGLEVRAGFSTHGADAGGYQSDLEHYASGLLKLGFPRSDKRLVPYVIGGYSYINMDSTPDTAPVFDDAEALTYGVGIDLYADAYHGLTFEWLRMEDEDDAGLGFDIEHFSVGYTRRF